MEKLMRKLTITNILMLFLSLCIVIGILGVIYSVNLSFKGEYSCTMLRKYIRVAEKLFRENPNLSSNGQDIVQKNVSQKATFSGTNKPIATIWKSSGPVHDQKPIPMFWEKKPQYRNLYLVISSDFKIYSIPAKEFRDFLNNEEDTKYLIHLLSEDYDISISSRYTGFYNFAKHCYWQLLGGKIE
jgi:hypothetical protein